MSKLKVYLISGIFIFFVFIIPFAVYGLNEESPVMSPEIIACGGDKDCMLVENQCNDIEAINKKYLKQWETAVDLIRQQKKLCPFHNATIMGDEQIVPKCQNGTCVVSTEMRWWAKNDTIKGLWIFIINILGKISGGSTRRLQFIFYSSAGIFTAGIIGLIIYYIRRRKK